VESGLIDKTAAFDLNQEISRIIQMKIKIGNEEKTLYELQSVMTLSQLGTVHR
jgi:hypothetical protein